ncbi:MAG: CDGSH iron-sulfur domain-containing protein [Phycicoccus sp.]|nr:CDGSH iron-sulfur domain-containing protein [Phycicoccus sp.]
MAQIGVGKDGPYAVRGLPLARARMETGDEGHGQAWVVHETIDTASEAGADGTYWLCRCGHSENKPFCDGHHRKVGFDGTMTASTTPYRERAKVMQGEGVVVRDVRPLCEHAGFCTLRETNVWQMVGSSDPETVATMEGMVDHCPSGALTRAADESALDDEPALPLQVLVVDDGPYLVTGGASLAGDDTAFESRNRMTLCRCGTSANKPFCDGKHAECGFRDS